MNPTQSPSQTVGPFFLNALIVGGENVIALDGAAGQRIVLTGKVLDGDGAAVPDALVELWHADAAGIYRHPADPRHAQADPQFRGFGRSETTHPDGGYRFESIKPGAVPSPDGTAQAPHALVRIFSRGLLTHLSTRLYFADEAEANARDTVLAGVPATRRATLLAKPTPAASGAIAYQLDFVLQGPGETVFFEP